MGTSLLIRVLHVSGICTTDADAGDVYCVLSTGACRFTTRNLCGKRTSSSTGATSTASTTSGSSSTSSSQEAFLLSPRDLKVASTRVLQAAAGSTTAPATPTAAHTDSSASHSSPVLSVEIYASKRWGSDAVTASGELLLGPLLQQLQPDGAPQQAKVMLHKPNAKTAAAAKAARSASTASAAAGAAAAAAAVVSTSPGIESGWVLGVESQVMVLELAAVSLPQVPMHLLGPVGSGRSEVPPVHSCNVAWLNRCPVLHTTGGHLYQTPSVQLVKVTLHRAQGLQNLHVDPVAAAAAAAAINRLAATGDSPIRSRAAERARQAATAATSLLESSKVGKSLLNKTGSWFGRSKQPAVASLASVTAAAAGSAQASGSVAPAGQQAAAADESKAAGSTQQQSRLANASVAAGSSSGASLLRAASPAAGAPAAAGSAAASPIAAAGGRSSPLPCPGSLAGQAVAVAADEDGVLLDSPRSTAAAEAAAAAAAAVAASAAEDEFDDDEMDDASLFSSSVAATGPGGDSSSCEDPVSRLKQALQHTRTDSVDAEAVMAALEENGFHATDAPGGAFVYAKLTLHGDSHTSRVVELGQAGEAVWEQSFWLAAARPAAPGTTLEVELLASKDDKTRGKPVAHVKAPLHQLLQQAHHADSSSSSSSVPWFKSRHVMQARFSDHLHGTLSFTVEAADWDSRAALAGLSRTLPEPEPAYSSSQSGAAGSRSPQKQRSSLQLSRTAAEAAAASGSAPGSPTAQQQQQVQQQQEGAAKAAALNRSDSSVSNKSEGARSTASGAGGATVTSGSSSSGSGGIAKGAAAADVSAAVQGAAAAAEQRAPAGMLDLAVKAFDTRKPLDVFFVLLLGPYCLVSSTSHSTHHHSWGWHLQLPLGDPSDMLTLALFAREDQAGGKRKVGASMLTNLFSSSIRLVGKLRVRLSTITPNAPLNITLPLQGERTNLRAGHSSAAVAHLYFHLRVPHLLRYLGCYFRFAACTPELYLLASSSSGWAGPGGGSQDCRLEALAAEVQETAARWMEQQQPCLPAKIFRKVQDDGRAEFTLSRTRANWRRLILLREAAAPAWAAFQHLCSWESTLHSVACYCVILLLGVYPSKVLSVLLLLCCIALARSAFSRPGKPTAAMVSLAAAAASTSGSSSTARSSSSTHNPAATAAVAAAGSSSSSSGQMEAGWQLLEARPPPVMCDVALASPDDALPGTAVPTDPYTSLKQNYDGLVQFLTLVQNVLDHWAAAGERLQLMFSWSDQLATAVVLLVLLLLAAGLWLLGLRVLVTAGLLWVFRHPILRDPLPPPPANFVAHMPTQSDVML